MTPLQDSIVTLTGSGMLMSEIIELPEMPSRQAIYQWLRSDKEFAAAYQVAQHIAADIVEEQIAAIAKSTKRETAAADRVRLEALRWRAGRLHPSKYAATGAALAEAAEDKAAASKAYAGARAELFRRLDAMSERFEADRLETVPGMIAAALDVVERHGGKPLDPVKDAEHILATVRACLGLPDAPSSDDAQESERAPSIVALPMSRALQ